MESFLYDTRVATRPSQPVSKEITLVLYDATSVEKLKGEIKLHDLIDLIRALKLAGPRNVLLSLRLEEIPGTPEEKAEFSRLTSEFPGLFVLTDEMVVKGEAKPLSLKPPFEKVPVISGPTTADTKIYARDGVTRRMLVSYQGIPLAHAKIAASYNTFIQNPLMIKNQFEFAGSDQVYIDFHPTGAYSRASFSQVAKSGATLSDFKDKVVIVGSDTAKDRLDYVLTPYSREVTAMTMAELHANMLDTLIKNSAPRILPDWLDTLFVILISTLTIYIVLTLKPVKGLLVLGATFLTVCLLGYLAFWPFGLWIDMAHPLLAIFLCYYFFIPYRLIIENRRSWEYYQKNRLLRQVEELKGNFISMMSHDLKTPIARIQGMTDVILADQVTLSSQQREAVDTIRHSSDDLLKFINAILNYGRIESEGVHLQLQSKDINALIKEVIKKNEFHAKVKHIQIVQELEPLFPLPVDPDLIKQVLSNLVENAIKYSPDNTKIMISSEERDGKVIVQVADQGFGIPTDELPNIFMKFFRSKDANSSPIKGSGLGLYLAKYFIELHQGAVFVESSYGQGSTFTVELPIKQG